MLNDIVKNKRLIGKSKDEIIRQLDTVDIKQYDYNDSVWMYVIEKPYSTRATENAIVVMDIEFEDELVSTIELRK